MRHGSISCYSPVEVTIAITGDGDKKGRSGVQNGNMTGARSDRVVTRLSLGLYLGLGSDNRQAPGRYSQQLLRTTNNCGSMHLWLWE